MKRLIRLGIGTLKQNLTSTFAKKAQIVVSGKAISQSITIFTLPILTRLYLPSQFGEYAMIMAASAFLCVILTLRYELAIMIPKSNDQAKQLLVLSLYFSIFLSAISYGILKFISQFFSDKYASLAGIIVAIALMQTILNIARYWFERNENFKISTFFWVFQLMLVIGFQFFFQGNESGLILGGILGLFVPSILSLGYIQKKYRPNLAINISQSRLLLKRYIKFPLFSIPGNLMNTASQNLHIILLAKFYGLADAGTFSIVLKIITAPINLISKSVNVVVFQTITRKIHSKLPTFPFIKALTIRMTLLGFCVAIAVFFVGKYNMLSLVLGEEWGKVNTLLIILIPYGFSFFISKSITRFAMFEKQEVGLIVQCILLTVVVSSILGSYALGKRFSETILIYSVATSICYILQISVTLSIAKKQDKTMKVN